MEREEEQGTLFFGGGAPDWSHCSFFILKEQRGGIRKEGGGGEEEIKTAVVRLLMKAAGEQHQLLHRDVQESNFPTAKQTASKTDSEQNGHHETQLFLLEKARKPRRKRKQRTKGMD